MQKEIEKQIFEDLNRKLKELNKLKILNKIVKEMFFSLLITIFISEILLFATSSEFYFNEPPRNKMTRYLKILYHGPDYPTPCNYEASFVELNL